MNILETQLATVATGATQTERQPLYSIGIVARSYKPFFVLLTPLQALDNLTARLVERYDTAEWEARCAEHRLSLGERYFDEEELATAQSELDAARAVMKRLDGWVMATCVGAPLEWWHAQAEELKAMLEAAQSHDREYGELTVEQLLEALVSNYE